MEKNVKGVRQSGPMVLQVRLVMGVMLIIGLAVFAAGMFMMFANDGDPSETWIFRLIAVPFLIGGAGILSYRSGWTFDRGANRITFWQGIFIPMKSRHHQGLSDFTSVGITMIKKRTRQNDHYEFPVWIETGGDRNRRINLFCEGNSDRSRAKARAIADFLQIPLNDHISQAHNPTSEWGV